MKQVADAHGREVLPRDRHQVPARRLRRHRSIREDDAHHQELHPARRAVRLVRGARPLPRARPARPVGDALSPRALILATPRRMNMRFADPQWLLVGSRRRDAPRRAPRSRRAPEDPRARPAPGRSPACVALRRPLRASDAGCASSSSRSRWRWASSRSRGRRRGCDWETLERKRDRSPPRRRHLQEHGRRRREADAARAREARHSRPGRSVSGRPHRPRRLRRRRLRTEPDDARPRRAPRIGRRARHVRHRARRHQHRPRDRRRDRGARDGAGAAEGDGAADRRRGPRGAGARRGQASRGGGDHHRHRRRRHARGRARPGAGRARGDGRASCATRTGTPVRSHLDEAGLQAIAAAAHGAYRPLGADGRGLDRLYDESLRQLTHAEASSRTRRVYSEWFEIPLGLALFGIVLDALLERRWRRSGREVEARSRPRAGAGGRRGRRSWSWAPRRPRACIGAERGEGVRRGALRRRRRRSSTSESARKPKDARLAFNAGDAAYRAGQYDAADAAFKRALAAADPELQQQVLYNDGDVLYRLGRGAETRGARGDDRASGRRRSRPTTAPSRSTRRTPTRGSTATSCKRKLEELEQKQKEPKKDDRRRTTRRHDRRRTTRRRTTRRTRQGLEGRQEGSRRARRRRGTRRARRAGRARTRPAPPTSNGRRPDARPAAPGTPTGATPGTGSLPVSDARDATERTAPSQGVSRRAMRARCSARSAATSDGA